MKTRFKLSALAIAFSFFCTGFVLASFNFGAFDEENMHEDDVSFGTAKKFSLLRHEKQIPKAYGRLITITSSNNKITLWFEADNGSIRNVILDGSHPLIIKRKGDLH